jgi:hypothetical protein
MAWSACMSVKDLAAAIGMIQALLWPCHGVSAEYAALTDYGSHADWSQIHLGWLATSSTTHQTGWRLPCLLPDARVGAMLFIRRGHFGLNNLKTLHVCTQALRADPEFAQLRLHLPHSGMLP